MKIDIHSHVISVAFLEHVQGRDTLPTAVRDGNGFITHHGNAAAGQKTIPA